MKAKSLVDFLEGKSEDYTEKTTVAVPAQERNERKAQTILYS
jgi:hypothetical protein